MSQFPVSTYRIFAVEGLHPVIFGESYVIVACQQVDGDFFKCEYNILTQRPDSLLDHHAWEFLAPRDVQLDVKFDGDWIIDQSAALAKIRLDEMLETRARKLESSPLDLGQFKLTEQAGRVLAGCWYRGTNKAGILDLSHKTLCEPLRQHLAEVCKLTVYHR